MDRTEEVEARPDVFGLLKDLKARGPALEWNPSVKCPVIIVYSEKGGVGKTALTNGLAAVLGANGVRVLVIDLDPRKTATEELGVDQPEFSVNDLLFVDPSVIEQEDPRGLALQAISPAGPEWPETVQLIASERGLGNREPDPTPGMENRLRLSLEGVLGEVCDVVLIDVPPRPGGKLVASAILAATHALLPGTLDEDGYIGVRDAVTSIRRARLSSGLPPLRLLGVVRNIVDRRATGVAQLYDQKFTQEFPPDGTDEAVPRLLADVAIPRYVVRQEARAARVPVTADGRAEARKLITAHTILLNRIAREI